MRDLSPRDIEHDNPEFRRLDEMVHFLEQIYGRKVEMDDIVTVVRFSQISDRPSEGRCSEPACARTVRRAAAGDWQLWQSCHTPFGTLAARVPGRWHSHPGSAKEVRAL